MRFRRRPNSNFVGAWLERRRFTVDLRTGDRVAVDNGRAWKSACKCVQEDVKKLPECSPDNASVLRDDTQWCESY